ncbi:hypothetical protein INS49_012147 [Diaporthe citri]|uniref:uncharacterized protein n=1 Tax=Diaporthe citri TaxID=83186 RepID=UPI001C81A06B|nr:uncharacterized protein INS49_012147 [Diaporthe citri]KAG6358629.1 hypothetical protein INS49_012147 [Diaporthe citri]
MRTMSFMKRRVHADPLNPALLSSAKECGLDIPGAGALPNGHAELEDWELMPRLLLCSAKHPGALRKSIQDHEAYPTSHPDSLRHMSFNLAVKRDHLPYRAFCVADGLDDLVPAISRRSIFPGSRGRPKVVFMFTGQGELTATGKKSRLSKAELSQPCCTALQVALVILLAKYGIHPDAVVGHSSGEIAAAFTSGLITANEAMLIAYYRGQAVANLDVVSHPGSMSAVGLSPEATVPYLVPGVVFCCENSPSSTTITGDAAAVKSVMQAIKKDNPDALVHHMGNISSAYRELLSGKILPKTGNVPFFSSVTGDIIVEGGQVGPEYWVRNLVSPVRFSTAIANVVDTVSERKVFLEIGPHSALAGPLRQNLDMLGSRDYEYVSTLTRCNDSQADVMKSVGSLWLQGLPLAYESITGRGRTLVDLPLYPWHYEEPLWRESRLSSGYRLRRFPHHDLLGSRVIESTDEFPSWRNILRPDLVDWLLQYETGCGTIFPTMGYICMAGEAVRQMTSMQSAGFTVRHVKIKTALVLNPGQEVEVITQFRRMGTDQSTEPSWYEFSVFSVDSSESWIKHAKGKVNQKDTFTSTTTELSTCYRNLRNVLLAKTTPGVKMLLSMLFSSGDLRLIKGNDDGLDTGGASVRRIAGDLVQRKRQARKEGLSPGIDILSILLQSDAFSDEELVDQAMTPLMASHETTAASITWAMYAMCRYPEVQTRMRQQIFETFPSFGYDQMGDDNTSVKEMIDRLPYLSAVCNEVLRLYPPGPRTIRMAIKDTTILGQHVPKGTPVIISPWAINFHTSG